MIGLLVRHGHAAHVDRWLAGRRDVGLSEAGREHARRLRTAFAWTPLTAVYSSPLQRAIDTAAPLAADHGLHVQVRPALTDMDFGEWTGVAVEELERDPAWQAFNRDRRRACPPGGEPLDRVYRRVVRELQWMAPAHPGETVVIVTHAELIRCALSAFSGRTLDEVLAVEIHPGWVSAIGIDPHFQCALTVDEAPDQAAE
jgi:broad specificity phosphatase PhoE